MFWAKLIVLFYNFRTLQLSLILIAHLSHPDKSISRMSWICCHKIIAPEFFFMIGNIVFFHQRDKIHCVYRDNADLWKGIRSNNFPLNIQIGEVTSTSDIRNFFRLYCMVEYQNIFAFWHVEIAVNKPAAPAPIMITSTLLINPPW